MKENETNYNFSFLSMLAIAFIVLKLCHIINWSWWLVLAPIWLPITLAIIVFIVIYAVGRMR